MNKFLLLFIFLFSTTVTFSQFSIEDYSGVPIEDGDIRSFGSVNPGVATLYFWIVNESQTDDILIRIKLESITNSNGDSFQFCFGGLCIFDVEEGQTYPLSGVPEVIPAGGTNPEFDKFQNENEGDGTNYPIDYVWKFFQVDENNNEIGESITFTYRYDSSLNTQDFQNNVGVNLLNTISDGFLSVSALETVDYKIYNINGQMITKGNITSGNSTIQTHNLTRGLYFVEFANNKGNKTTLKFVVR